MGERPGATDRSHFRHHGRELAAQALLDDLDGFRGNLLCQRDALGDFDLDRWVELRQDLRRGAWIEVSQDDGDRLRMLFGEQTGSLGCLDVAHEVERDDLLSLMDPVEQFAGLVRAEGLGEQFDGVVLAAGQYAGMGEETRIGLFEDRVASAGVDRRHPHQFEGNAIERLRRQAGQQLRRGLGAERDQQGRGLARSTE